MTIIEAVKYVLSNSTNGLTSQAVYEQIVEQQLYVFGAKNPAAVVNGEIRRRCVDLDFPTASPVKLFEISGFDGKKPLFRLIAAGENSGERKHIINLAQNNSLPEERLGVALTEHMDSVKASIHEAIVANSPAFFEHLVMDLLLEMGYGADKSSGTVTGRSHDGGIDGIISEDKLGLDLIYIQAKRYSSSNKVGRKEIQMFIGAMENVQKGIFITTSSYTKEAIAFVEKQQQKRVRLIDGNMLVDLLIKYKVGVDIAKTIYLYRIDMDYFSE